MLQKLAVDSVQTSSTPAELPPMYRLPWHMKSHRHGLQKTSVNNVHTSMVTVSHAPAIHHFYCPTRGALKAAAYYYYYSAQTGIRLIDWVQVLRPIRHKVGHFGDVLPSQSLSLVLKNKIKQQKQTKSKA